MPEKKGLDLDALKEIIKIIKEYDLSEICIEQNGLKIQVRQGQPQVTHSVYSVPVQTISESDKSKSEVETSVETSVFISSPTIGTFYEAPKPGEKPYAKIGDSINAGEVVCIIEAMKLMNEITSDMDCEIIEVMVKNGQTVEAEQPLFRVRPKA